MKTAVFLIFAFLNIVSRNIEQYSVPEKLSTLDKCAISALTQDSKGALWMTTSQGLFRYDGAELVCYDENARETPLCRCGDDICYGSGSEIIRLTSAGKVNYGCRREFIARESILVGNGEKIAVCYNHRIMEETGDSLLVTVTTGMQSGKITAAGFYRGEMIVGTASGYIYKVAGEFVDSLFRCPSGVSSIFTDSKSRLWVGLSEGGVLRFDKTDFSEVKTSTGETPRGVRCFCPDNVGGEILLGSVDGLYSIGEDMQIVRDQIHAPSGHAIKTLLRDGDGTVWVGTHYNGVIMFNPYSPIRYVYGSHDNARLINAIVQGVNGQTWLVTDHYGIFVQDKSGRRLIPGTTEMKFKSAIWNSGALWVGEYMGGLCKYHPNDGKWEHFNFINDQGEPSLLSTYALAAVGDEIYLGTNSGLYVFNPSIETQISRKIHDLKRKIIYSLDVASDGTLWIGTNGVYSYSVDGILDSVEELEGEKCRCVDASGNRVIASVLGKGFCSLDRDGVSWFLASACGMSSNEVYAIHTVGDTLAVAGTSEGLSFIRMTDGCCINYDSPLWMDTGSFLDGCIVALSDGYLWAGGTDGIVEITPSLINFNIVEHPLVFDRLELNGEDCSYLLSRGTIRIPHDRNNVTLSLSDFNLAALRYADNTVCSEEFNIHEDGVKSSYKLNFRTLRRGTYSVSVSSEAVPSGILLNGQTLRIKVLAPWYSSVVAMLGYAILVFLLTALAFKHYRDQEKMIADLEEKYSSLLEIQKKYWSGMADAAQVAGSKKDTEFLQDISSFVERNINAGDLSVSLLCDHACMGRTAFTEKIKSLTGMPPRDFIEATKLKKAAQMLVEGEKNVSEIAYALGFNSPKYFSIRFRNQFGMTPSEWSKR